MPIHNVPLTRHVLVDTRSPEEAREQVGRIFCPHFLTPKERRPETFHTRHHSAPQLGYSVNYVAYGAEVEIDPGQLTGFFLLQWPLRGAATVKCGSTRAEAVASATASLLSPTLPTLMTWHEGCEKLIILVRREALQKQCEALLGEPARPVEFDVDVAMKSPTGELLLRHLQLMRASVEGEVCAPEPYQVLLCDALTTLLLCSLRHNQSALLEIPARAPAPKAVRRAEEYIDAHLDGSIAVAEVAAAAGANLRSLQTAFKSTRGSSMSQSIHNKRLDRFRAALIDPDGLDSVTAIAYTVGLGHLGRAAAAYRARYGETPQQTLRRRR